MKQMKVPRRQIYNRQQLNKQLLKNREITRPRTQKKTTIAKEIVKEIEKEENNDIEMSNNDEKEKAGEKEQISENEKEEKEEKKKIIRLKLDAKTLLYNNDNGLRKYYEVITNTEFNSKDNEKNLDKLINLTRNWHFMLFPNYDFDYFTNKLISLGKQAPTKAFMSRIRRIYKGEEKWDVIYDEQAQILGKASIMNEKKEPAPNQENQNKEESVKMEEKEKKEEIVKQKGNNLEYDEEDQAIIQDLILNDDNLEENDKKREDNKNKNEIENGYEIKDSDFDNFPQDYEPEEEYQKNIENKSKKESNESSLIKKNEDLKDKRTSKDIFGENKEELKPDIMKTKMDIEK